MLVEDAQREVRTVFLGGFVGQLVSSILWVSAASAGTLISLRAGILSLVVGGMFIFPLTQLALGAAGRKSRLSRQNPLAELAVAVAFQVPLLLPLAGAATLHRAEWFFPSCMVIVGVHYLPFSFLYGMRMFWALGGLLICGGLIVGMYFPSLGAVSGFACGLVLLLFALIGRTLAARSEG